MSNIGCTTMKWNNRVRRHNIEDMKEMKRLCKIIAPNNSEIHSPRIRKCLFFKICQDNIFHILAVCVYLRISHKGFSGVWIYTSIVTISIDFPSNTLDLRIIKSSIHNFFTIGRYPNSIVLAKNIL